MSKFFMAGSSSSDSDDSDGEDVPQVPRARPVAPSMFLPMSDDEDDVKRTVRSLKDKRYDEIQSAIKQMRNSMKIKDIAKVLTEWENMCKAYVKAKTVIEKEGIPSFYIKSLAELEDFVQNQWEDKESRQKLSKVNAKALASLRQKMKKYNRDFEEKIKDYRENPGNYEEADEDEDDEQSASDDESDLDEIEGPSSFMKDSAPKYDMDRDDDESDDSLFGGDDESETSSDDDLPAGGTRVLHASMFLKTDKSETKVSKKQKKEKPEKEMLERGKEKERLEKKIAIMDSEGFIEVTREKSRQLFPKDTEINHQAILKKLQEILAVRGKKSTDKPDQVGYFKELKKISEKHNLGAGLSLKITFNIMAAIFDSSPSTDAALKPEMWRSALEEIQNILTILEETESIQVADNIADDAENVEKETEPYRVRGCPYTVLERLYSEFIKILQHTDCHSTEYVDRLRDEAVLTKIILRMQSYLEKHSTPDLISKVYLLRIEHIYYKLDMKALKKIREQVEKGGQNQVGLRLHKEPIPEKITEPKEAESKPEGEPKGEEAPADADADADAVADADAEKEKAGTEGDAKDDVVGSETNSEVIDRLCKYVYTKGSDRVRTRAMLCHIYNHALHDRLYEARDLMLISHLQEEIQHSDIPTQILYNRTMVQFGLCAFRHGKIRDAHNALIDIQSTGRAKELLAQGLMNLKMADKSPEQEKIEKRRLLPFHMHINLELLECVYLTSALLLEIPYMAAREFDSRRRIISKSLHHQLRLSDRQPLVGPPETMREHIVAAVKSMKKGDWKKCSEYILAVKSWNLFSKADEVKEMLKNKIKEESLRTYLFTFNKVYDSLSMLNLAEMFELPPQVVHSIVSKMIINEELQASWDEPTQTLILNHGAEPTLLQSLTLQLADKIGTLVDNHERIIDFKHGGYFDKGRQGRFRHGR